LKTSDVNTILYTNQSPPAALEPFSAILHGIVSSPDAILAVELHPIGSAAI
jgi:hypothetical protein